jgi:hypothetical protein
VSDALTDFIIKPSGPFAAGVVLFGVVWAFFKGVESVLSDDTKLEIAVWLVGVVVGKKVKPWPETFERMFERIFGDRHVSWKCLRGSAIVSVFVSFCVQGVWYLLHPKDFPALASDAMRALGILDSTLNRWLVVPLLITGNALLVNGVADYFSLWKTRSLLKRFQSPTEHRQVQLLFLDTLLSGLIGATALIVMVSLIQPILYKQAAFSDIDEFGRFLREMIFGGYVYGDNGPPESTFFYPAFFPSIWLWLYAGSGFLLKAASRFDASFQWFSRKTAIDKYPLSAIGLVAGSIVAVAYWAIALLSSLIHHV